MNNYSFSDSYNFAEDLKKKNQSYVDAVKDQSGEVGLSDKEKAETAASVSKALQGDGKSSGMSNIGNAMIAGSTMSGPAAPWLLGGGLVMSTAGNIIQEKQAQENLKRQAYLDTIKNQQNAIDGFQRAVRGNMLIG